PGGALGREPAHRGSRAARRDRSLRASLRRAEAPHVRRAGGAARSRAAGTRQPLSTMARTRTLYQCSECGASAPKWTGQCADCGAWNTLVETVAEPVTPKGGRHRAAAGAEGVVRNLSEVRGESGPRIGTGLEELDRA